MDFPPDARVPFAHLRPSLDPSVGFVEGLVTLIWPYSSSNRSTSILLVEPDFRLRPNHGQVRISFTGPSATAIAKSGLTSGDRVSVRLAAAVWLPEDTGGTTAGRGPGWELQYGQSLTLQIAQEAREPFLVEVDSTSPILAPQDVVRTPPQSPQSRHPLSLHVTDVTQEAAKTWSSPAFLKRKSLADTSFFDSVYDPFIDDGEDTDNRPRKKARFGRRSDQWTFLERTPSPEVESEHENFEASTRSVQKHGQEEQVILTSANAPSVRNSELSDTIDHVVITQKPGSPENQSQIGTPALFAIDDYSDTRENTNGLPLALPSLSNVPPSLERGREETIHLSERSEHGDAHNSESASFESGNNEALKQLSEADGLEQALPLQINAYEGKTAEGSNEYGVLHKSDVQQQQRSLEIKGHGNPDSEFADGFELDEDMRGPSSLIAPPVPVSDLVHFDLDGAMISRLRPSEHETHDDESYHETPVALEHVTEPSIANTSRTGERSVLEVLDEISNHETDIRNIDALSDGSSRSEMQDASAIFNTQREASVLEDGSDILGTNYDRDGASSVETEKEADFFRLDIGERENTIDSVAEALCEDSAEVVASAFDEDGKIIEVVDVDSEDDEEETALDEEEESGDSDYDRMNLLEHPAEVRAEGSEGSKESYQSGEDSVLSFAEVTRTVFEHHDKDEDSKEESESDEDAELVESESDGPMSILEYPTIPPSEGSEKSEGSQHSVQDDFMSFIDAAHSIVEHDHAVEDNGTEYDSNEDPDVAKLENDDQMSTLEYPDELPREGPDGSQHSDNAEAVLLVEPAISELEHGHRYGDEVDVAKADEDSVIVDLEDDSQINMLEYPAEVSNKEIDESFSPDIDQATSFARAATSLIEHDQKDEIDEEPDSDVDEKSADLGGEGQVGARDDSVVSFIAASEKTYPSDAKEAVSMAESARSVADDGREDQPDSQSYSALARDAVQQAELQEGITMDDALYLPTEQPSSPSEDHIVHQGLEKDCGSGQVVHDSGEPGDRFSFPFTPQLSGLSALYPEPGAIVEPPNTHHRPAEGVIVNPTSSFTLPDYDSVLEDFDTQPGEQLITPLATQNPEPEEEGDDMKSQLDLDLEDEISNRRMDDLVEDDTVSLPLPVINAVSHSLVEILRNLGRSSEVRAAKSRNEDLSGHTELWSNVSASKENVQKDERSSPRESESVKSLVNHDRHRKARLLELSHQQDVSDSTKIEGDLSKHPTDIRIPLQTSQLGFRTQFSYFAFLSTLQEHFNSTIDVLATVLSSTKASRATKGPRDYHLTVFVADSSSALTSTIPSCTTVQIFRPYKQALPILRTGDALLLRNFKVQMQKHDPMLLSTEYSAWAVFREDTDVQIRGPHVEFGEEEIGFAKDLTEWWHSLGSEDQSQLASSVPQAESSSRGTPKAKKKEKRVSEVVHQLRDGTKYTDSSADMNSIHELRDGTMYADDEVL
ncbi:hypothetical protein MMC17_003865 [Xylographa soralifera]|nr:hypothetical protein [Xylographa soralifera]